MLLNAAAGRPSVSTDIYSIDVASGTATPLTSDPSAEYDPAFSPDGLQIAFNSNRVRSGGGAASFTLYRRPTTGRGDDQPFEGVGDLEASRPEWSGDGTFLVFDGGQTADIWALGLADHKRIQFTKTPFAENSPTLSPDGKWVAYASNEPGRSESMWTAFRTDETNTRSRERVPGIRGGPTTASCSSSASTGC